MGANAAVGTGGVNIFDATGNRETGCTSFIVFVASGGNNCRVTIPGLTDAAGSTEGYTTIPAGGQQTFRSTEMGIRRVTAAADTGTVAIFYGVVAKTGGV